MHGSTGGRWKRTRPAQGANNGSRETRGRGPRTYRSTPLRASALPNLTRQASAGRRSSLGWLSPASDSPHLSTVRAQSARLTVIDAFSGLIRLRHHDRVRSIRFRRHDGPAFRSCPWVIMAQPTRASCSWMPVCSGASQPSGLCVVLQSFTRQFLTAITDGVRSLAVTSGNAPAPRGELASSAPALRPSMTLAVPGGHANTHHRADRSGEHVCYQSGIVRSWL
jgi:hypothetical protein